MKFKITPKILRTISKRIETAEESYMCIALGTELALVYKSLCSETRAIAHDFIASFDCPTDGDLGFNTNSSKDSFEYNEYSNSIRVMFLELLALYLEDQKVN